MTPTNEMPQVLVVDDDEVLLRILDGVLTRSGFKPAPATTVADAARLADTKPDLALIDRCLPDGDGVDLARMLRRRYPDLPMILMTAYPTPIADRAMLFADVLEKPMDLDVLRESLQAARTGQIMKVPTLPSSVDQVEKVERPNVAAAPAVGAVTAMEIMVQKPEPGSRLRALQSAGVLVMAGLVLLVFIGYSIGVRVPGMAAEPEEKTVQAPPPLPVRLVPAQPGTLMVPKEVRESLGILKDGREQVKVVQAPTQGRPLVLHGSTAFDPTKLKHIRARFTPAEVVQIGQVAVPPGESGSGRTEYRELRTGDIVRKGDVLGVFFSVDVGSKKNDLLDALVQLEVDQPTLDQFEQNRESVPDILYRNQIRIVQGDRNNISRALNTLKMWNIPQEDIDALHEEAKKISQHKSDWHKTPEGAWVKREKQAVGTAADPDRENDNPWGRVTLRAPDDGIIVERNISTHDIVQDPTVCLFQIAQVNRLLIVANVPEDDLPKLQDLSRDKRRWTVRTLTGFPPKDIEGTIDEFSYLIDVNQHSAVVKGYIQNPERRLVAGQFITASVTLDPPKNVVEVPINAIIDEGRQCFVFVQTDPAKQHFQLRRVLVTQRFEKTAYVKSALTEAEVKLTPEQVDDGFVAPLPLEKGSRVLTAGALELKKELEDLTSRATK